MKQMLLKKRMARIWLSPSNVIGRKPAVHRYYKIAQELSRLSAWLHLHICHYLVGWTCMLQYKYIFYNDNPIWQKVLNGNGIGIRLWVWLWIKLLCLQPSMANARKSNCEASLTALNFYRFNPIQAREHIVPLHQFHSISSKRLGVWSFCFVSFLSRNFPFSKS